MQRLRTPSLVLREAEDNHRQKTTDTEDQTQKKTSIEADRTRKRKAKEKADAVRCISISYNQYCSVAHIISTCMIVP